jgi:hypothetical protein
MLDIDILIKFAPASVATAFASIVFPVPGGPKSNIPLQGCKMNNHIKKENIKDTRYIKIVPHSPSLGAPPAKKEKDPKQIHSHGKAKASRSAKNINEKIERKKTQSHSP